MHRGNSLKGSRTRGERERERRGGGSKGAWKERKEAQEVWLISPHWFQQFSSSQKEGNTQKGKRVVVV